MDLQQTSQNWLCIQLSSIFSKEFPILVFQPIHLYGKVELATPPRISELYGHFLDQKIN
jgi:hypothetical protein